MSESDSENDGSGYEPGSAYCQCETPKLVRTLAKGTPAEKKYCKCGGRVDGREKILSAIERRKGRSLDMGDEP